MSGYFSIFMAFYFCFLFGFHVGKGTDHYWFALVLAFLGAYNWKDDKDKKAARERGDALLEAWENGGRTVWAQRQLTRRGQLPPERKEHED